jgi:hypothetical protein
MSHFSKIKTHITDKDLLIQSIRDLGYTVNTDKTSIKGFRGEETPADLCISVPGEKYEIGFLCKEGRYDIIADWWGLGRLEKKTFHNQLAQKYAYLAAKQSLSQQGFIIAREETAPNGEIKLILRRMVE